jgi:hypothetical protein
MSVNELEPRRADAHCPTCGVRFALVVGSVGPCRDCERAAEAERAERREWAATPHPCEDCGRSLVGRATYCGSTCRMRAWRRRRREAAERIA